MITRGRLASLAILAVVGASLAFTLVPPSHALSRFDPTPLAETEGALFTKYDKATCHKTASGGCYCASCGETCTVSCELVFNAQTQRWICVDTNGNSCQ